jgi:ribosome-associated protein
MITITRNISIDEREIHEEFIRADGPGGQNVNKVSTAVQLRFDVKHSPSLPFDVKQRLIRLAGKRMTSRGELIIEARRFRFQERNRQDALERLKELIRKAAFKPKPRRPTKPTHSSKIKRLEHKRVHSQKKQSRQKVSYTD